MVSFHPHKPLNKVLLYPFWRKVKQLILDMWLVRPEISLTQASWSPDQGFLQCFPLTTALRWYSYYSGTEGNIAEKNSNNVAKFPNGISINTITAKLIVSPIQDKKLPG